MLIYMEIDKFGKKEWSHISKKKQQELTTILVKWYD